MGRRGEGRGNSRVGRLGLKRKREEGEQKEMEPQGMEQEKEGGDGESGRRGDS